VAFDIARGARWSVGGSSPSAPRGRPGLGYVLHNRLGGLGASSRHAFRDLRVQHIASELPAPARTRWRDPRAQAVAGGQAPRIVLLTPGPYSETWFEQAYLARYLGLPLVEGGDLTVRAEHGSS
jgi:uncharacterized circularly permuted ATP-grasp superfamily protein